MLLLVIGLQCKGTAQTDSLSLLRTKTILRSEKVDSVYFDEQQIVPGSVKLSAFEDQFQINEQEALLYEIENNGLVDSFFISYRIFPFRLESESNQLKEYKNAKQDSIEREIFIINQQKKSDIFEFDNLQISGGLGRALNFGNNQNLVVNSNLNLRLSGTVADGVNVVGVLTDDNVPFQPQGNSQQIRELDQVFLQFSKNDQEITLGDYEYRRPTSYFLNFDKRLQGVNYFGKFSTESDWKITTSNSGAVSRGKYAQNQFLGQEGNQGPYKLFGANNESFIIILAGTEQVFIDGVLLERGLDRDYTIDYNTGEITFTSQQLITNRTRVAIEFEYTNQTYNSSLIFSETEFKKENLAFRLNVYSEQDNRNRARLTDTTLNTSGLFNNLGDNQENFFFDSFRETDFAADRIQYELVRDTIINGEPFDSVFVYSNNPQLDLFQVIFTFVGQNAGNYRVTNQLTNGRVYEWIPPVNGIPQGDYVALIRLSPPTQRQLASLTTSYRFSNSHNLSLETSVSNRDLNTLSDIGNDDNTGFGAKVNWDKAFQLGSDSLKNRLVLKVDYEFKGNQFRSIERYRPIEFSRDWNTNINATDSLQEGYGNFTMQYVIDPTKQVGYTLSSFQQDDLYSGFKHTGSFRLNDNGYLTNITLDYLNAEQTNLNSSFFRPRVHIEKSFNALTLGTRLQQNQREFTEQDSGNLTAASIGDEDYSIYLQTADSSAIPITVTYNRHLDSTPFEDELADLFKADEVSMQGAWRTHTNHRANWTVTYRSLQVIDSTLTDDENKNSILGKFNYAGNFLNNVLKTGFDYEIGSGREPRREFSYIEVANGEGVYTWIDYNNNGLQEVTEFEIAPFSDQARFVRVFTNTNEYINADTGRLNQWLQLEPVLAWRDEDGLKGFMSKFSLNSTLSVSSKLFENASGARFNPYQFSVQKEGLVSSNNRFSNRLIYNKLSDTFRATYLFQQNDSKSQLLSGFEQREKQEHRISTDIYFKNKLTFQLEGGWLNNSFFSENFSQKTFDFDQITINPKLTWVLDQQLRLGAQYRMRSSDNIEELGGQSANTNSMIFDMNWNKRNQFALQARFNYDDVNYVGQQNEAVAFSMLNGLQNGKNLLWNITFERNILESLRVNLTYDGRKLGDVDPVHTGRARITAVF